MITELQSAAWRAVRRIQNGTGNYAEAVDAIRNLEMWLDEGTDSVDEEAADEVDALREALRSES